MVSSTHPLTFWIRKPRHVMYGTLLQRQAVLLNTCGLCADVQHSGLAEIHIEQLPLYLVRHRATNYRIESGDSIAPAQLTACPACALAACQRAWGFGGYRSRQCHTWATPVVPLHYNTPAKKGK